MSEHQGGRDHISATITGNVSGQVGVGSGITQNQQIGVEPVTPEEREELRRLFADVRARLAVEAPPGQEERAIERLDELEEAVTAEEPDVTTMSYVRNWFVSKLPSVAGLVTSVLVNPIVGKIAQSAGQAAADEWGSPRR
ncbi:MAG: hypothetical protein M3203_06010 [Actinomycetota bacterium]|nr:hypothetical protein [Actinomycetota bacterium]